jgi:hypothetical protein
MELNNSQELTLAGGGAAFLIRLPAGNRSLGARLSAAIQTITRGEMALILDRIMHYQVAGKNTFTDLKTDFYTDAILKANAAGVMLGYKENIWPTADITRQDAFVPASSCVTPSCSSISSNSSSRAARPSKRPSFIRP